MGEDVKLMLSVLARGENAMNLSEFAEATKLSMERLAAGLDLLVALRILQSDYSLHRSDIGEVIYMFADNENAQAIYDSIVGK